MILKAEHDKSHPDRDRQFKARHYDELELLLKSFMSKRQLRKKGSSLPPETPVWKDLRPGQLHKGFRNFLVITYDSCFGEYKYLPNNEAYLLSSNQRFKLLEIIKSGVSVAIEAIHKYLFSSTVSIRHPNQADAYLNLPTFEGKCIILYISMIFSTCLIYDFRLQI